MDVDGFLGVPTSLGIEVDDMVEVSSGPASKMATPGAVLVAKACDALAGMGYGDADVRKVGGLVARNMMTGELIGEGSQNESNDESKDVKGQVGLMLKSLLDSKRVNMNSNEPVVLINHGGGDSRLVDQTVAQLHHEHNIWPVRVYAGQYIPEKGTSVTLLNVVNTDIGGPSMVQLLDAPCEAPEWSRWQRREAWRERELLCREEQSLMGADDESEKSVISDDDDGSLNSAGESEPEPEQDDQFEQHDDGPSASGQSASPQNVPFSQDTAEPPEETPLPQEPAEPEPALPERRIEHPTWKRPDDGTSLLDLIRSQASLLVPFGKDEPPSTEPEEDDKGTTDRPEAKGDRDTADRRALQEEESLEEKEEFVLV